MNLENNIIINFLPIQMNKNNIEIETVLISMYSKCGYLEKAIQVFENMKERNIVTYNSMII